jgi:hypothetical protein
MNLHAKNKYVYRGITFYKNLYKSAYELQELGTGPGSIGNTVTRSTISDSKYGMFTLHSPARHQSGLESTSVVNTWSPLRSPALGLCSNPD